MDTEKLGTEAIMLLCDESTKTNRAALAALAAYAAAMGGDAECSEIEQLRDAYNTARDASDFAYLELCEAVGTIGPKDEWRLLELRYRKAKAKTKAAEASEADALRLFKDAEAQFLDVSGLLLVRCSAIVRDIAGLEPGEDMRLIAEKNLRNAIRLRESVSALTAARDGWGKARAILNNAADLEIELSCKLWVPQND